MWSSSSPLGSYVSLTRDDNGFPPRRIAAVISPFLWHEPVNLQLCWELLSHIQA